MLTPRDIETREFSRARSGYKTDEVEAFLDEVLADYTKLVDERDSYAKRVLAISEKLEAVREEQQNDLQKILEVNFKTREEIISEAKVQAAQIISEAKSEKEQAILNIESELIKVKSELEKAKLRKNLIIKEVDDFKAVLKKAYEEHLKLLDNLPNMSKEEVIHKPEYVPEPPKAEKPAETDAPVVAADAPTYKPKMVDVAPAPIEEPEDLSATIIMKPSVSVESRKPVQLKDVEDDDLILSSSSNTGKSRIRPDEDKIKGLFDHDSKKEKKPFKKQSKFFKQDNDDFFDDDFDDE